MTYSRLARRERDLEVLPALVARLLDAIDEVDEDREGAMESAVREETERRAQLDHVLQDQGSGNSILGCQKST